MPDTDTLTDVEVDAELADRLRDAQQAFDEVREYLEGIKDEVKARYSGSTGVRGVHAGEEIFTCVRRESTRLNSARLKREYPDIWSQYAKTGSTVYMRIRVTRPEASA